MIESIDYKVYDHSLEYMQSKNNFKINTYFSESKLFYAYLKFIEAKQQMYNKFRYWLDDCGN